MIFVFFVFFVFCVFVHANETKLPVLDSFSSELLSYQKEAQISHFFLKKLYQDNSIVKDEIILNYLNDLVSKLVKVSDLPDKKVIVVLIDNDDINAFAVPGGLIGVNVGLILKSKNEAELASVLAHEIAHLSQRHFARMLESQKNNKYVLLASILGGLLLGGSAGFAVLSSTVAGNISQQLHFSREQEEEADRIGLNLLYKANFNPYAMPNFFQKLQAQHDDISQPLPFLQTHPLTLDRIAQAKERASQFPLKKYSSNDFNFEIVKMRLQVRKEKDIIPFILSLEKNLQKKPRYPTILNYGIALALFKNHEYDKALKQINSFLKNEQNVIAYQLLYYQLLFYTKNKEKSFQLLISFLHDHPENLSANMLYASLLYKNKLYMRCKMILKKLILRHPDYVFAWELLSETIGNIGDKIDYYQSHAMYLNLVGKMEQALEELNYALNNLKMTYSQRKAIQQKTIQLKKEQKNYLAFMTGSF